MAAASRLNIARLPCRQPSRTEAEQQAEDTAAQAKRRRALDCRSPAAMAAVPALHGANYGTWMQEFSGNSSIDLLQTPQTSEFDLFLNDGPPQSTPRELLPRCGLPPHLLARLLDG